MYVLHVFTVCVVVGVNSVGIMRGDCKCIGDTDVLNLRRALGVSGGIVVVSAVFVCASVIVVHMYDGIYAVAFGKKFFSAMIFF